MKIVYLVEEHHEVFPLWSAHGLENQTLLHADTHADMDLPDLSVSISNPLTSEEIAQLTYSELDIQTFITAGVYRRMFQKVIWLRPSLEKLTGGSTFIWSENNEGKRLFMATKSPKESDSHNFYYQWTSPKHGVTIGAEESFILDIDLDFFSCGGAVKPAVIEITEDEYNKFQTDRRHYMRCHFGSRVRATETEGQYFFELTPLDGTHRAGLIKVTDEEAIRKISRFGDLLRTIEQPPGMITICRSRLSGYTPEDQWQLLEEETLAMLGDLYGPVKAQHIDDHR